MPPPFSPLSPFLSLLSLYLTDTPHASPNHTPSINRLLLLPHIPPPIKPISQVVYGGNIVASMTLLSETLPTRSRGLAIVSMEIFFGVGSVFGTCDIGTYTLINMFC